MLSFMNRLQTRIFGFFVLLLIAVQAFSFWMAYYSFNTLEKQQLDNRMSVAENVFHSEFDTRSHYLSIFAETVAKDFGLKETFIDGEQKSFLIALNNHRGRVKAEMAMAISKDGTVIGQLVSEATEAGKYKVKVGSEQGTKSALMLEKSIADFDSLYRLDGKVYQLRFATLTSGDSNTIGWIGFGFVVDSKLASIMEDQTGLPTGFALSSESTPPQFLAHSEIDIAPKVKTVLESFFKEGAENEDYLLWNQSLGKLGNESLYAYMYLPRADVLEALKKQWWRQFWLVLLMLPLSLFAAFGISGSITKPIMRLIEQAKFIAQGNYDAKVKPSSTLELAQLAHEFTEMQTAILSREQKIVHQAFHDTLTNLPNRNELERVVSEWVDGGSHVIICLLNIRRLTDVNVTLGHMVGDEVIKEVGHRLEKMSNVDIVCRLSGDEYAMALKDFDDVELSMLLQQVQ
ncbi:MAG: diguanylate cyclase, partial [Shewanella sp.]|nr:diguanylate cyclase [Shewanella sp.]